MKVLKIAFLVFIAIAAFITYRIGHHYQYSSAYFMLLSEQESIEYRINRYRKTDGSIDEYLKDSLAQIKEATKERFNLYKETLPQEIRQYRDGSYMKLIAYTILLCAVGIYFDSIYFKVLLIPLLIMPIGIATSLEYQTLPTSSQRFNTYQVVLVAFTNSMLNQPTLILNLLLSIFSPIVFSLCRMKVTRNV